MKKTSLTRLLFPGTCVLVAFLAARHVRQPAKPLRSAESTIQEAAPPISTTILNRLPTADSNSRTGKLLAAALLKIRTSPDEPKYWIETGDAFAQLQRESEDPRYYDSAESVYTEALRLTPRSVKALTGMAWVTGGRHQFDQSTAWANQALAVDPRCIEALGILGDAALELGEYDLAFANYQKMMDLRPDLSSWSRGAHLLWVTGETNKAMMLMGKAISAGAPFAENTAWCRIRMAAMLINDGAVSPAEDYIRPLLEAGSKNSHLLLLAARIASAKQDYPLAEKYYRTLLESAPNQQACGGLGDLMTIGGKAADAETFYQTVESLHAAHLKDGVHDHGFMARFLADHDRNLVEALRMAEEHKLTKNVQEADTLAWVYYKNGMLPQAVATMKKALSRHTPDPEMHYHAGMIASAYGDIASAKSHLEQALAMNPNFNLIQAPLAVQALEQLAQRKSNSQADATTH